jgi:cytidylate kinase
MIIAIDGPAGSGKTTVSRLLAQKLKISYLDTGATYRALTLKVLEEGVDLANWEAVKNIAENLNLQIKDNKIYLNGRDISEQIRAPLIDINISKVASNPLARQALVGIQQKMAKDRDIVVEGRDITTVVFPEAKFKFYLDAEFEVRVKRRYNELKNRGIDIPFAKLKAQLKQRDNADLHREVSPLKRSEDAIYIDTTNLTIEEVVDKLASYIRPSF